MENEESYSTAPSLVELLFSAKKNDERGEDRTRDLRFRRPTQYPLCHTPKACLLYFRKTVVFALFPQNLNPSLLKV